MFKRILSVRLPVYFRRLKGMVGYCRFGEYIVIDLNCRRLSPAQVYLHECVHALYPKWLERKVLTTERRMWKRLTRKQKFLLNRKLFHRSFRDWKPELE